MREAVIVRSYLAAFVIFLVSAAANAALLVTTPSDACSLLNSHGLATRGWKHQYDNEFRCSSPYKEIGTGFPLANNLAYYVDGGPTTARRAKLVLNVNDSNSAALAHRELLKAAEVLSTKATGMPLPKEIGGAIVDGTMITRTVGPAAVEVLRIDWPTGKGYELKVVFE